MNYDNSSVASTSWGTEAGKLQQHNIVTIFHQTNETSSREEKKHALRCYHELFVLSLNFSRALLAQNSWEGISLSSALSTRCLCLQ